MEYKSAKQIGQDASDLRVAEAKILPPANVINDLSEGEIAAFDEIISEAPILYWTPFKIRRAVMLARMIVAAEKEFESYMMRIMSLDYETDLEQANIPIDFRVYGLLMGHIARLSKELRIVYTGIPNNGANPFNLDMDNPTTAEQRALVQMAREAQTGAMIRGQGQLIELLAN